MFKNLKQFISVILLSFILIISVNTVFAQTSTTYEECIQAFTSNKDNYAACDALQKEAEKCFADAEIAFKEICSAQFAEQKKLCEAALSSACLNEIDDKEAACIKALKENPQSLAGCMEKENQAKACITKAEQGFETICRAQFPEKTTTTASSSTCGNGILEEGEECDDGNRMSGDGCDANCMTEDVIPPAIPKISTLPGPDAPTVGNVSPYLMSTFLPRVAKTIISFAIGAAVLGLILSAIGLLTAYGNEEKYGNAKKGLYFSMIGLVISLLAFAIVQLIFFTGFQIGNL